jgi:DNA polymerase III gamma/tau subunit
MSLIFKYTPRSLEEFDIDTNKLFHETHLLLIGGEQTGKTTLVNILVKKYLPYDHLDHVLYINNLKEQGIQYYRTEVKNFCQTTLKNRIVVIDNLDELSDQIQQIFLNYINKFVHVKFIATAKNKHKIIEPMFSKFITIPMMPMSHDYITSFIKKVIRNENISMDETAIQTIMRMSKNSLGTILNQLEMYKIIGVPITNEYILQTQTCIHHEMFDEFTKGLFSKNMTRCMQIFNQMFEDGYSVIDLLDTYYQFVKMNDMNEIYKYMIIKNICKYIVIYNTIHEHQIELIFFIHDCINKISTYSHNPNTLHK